MIVNVRYPALVEHLPRRTRKPRSTVVAREHPVALREVSPTDLGWMPSTLIRSELSWDGPEDLALLDGHAYRWLMHPNGRVPVTRSELADFLGGDADGNADHIRALRVAFLRTPLLGDPLTSARHATSPVGLRKGIPAGPTLGDVIDPDDRAHARMAAFMDQVVVAADAVLLRYMPIALTRSDGIARLVTGYHFETDFRMLTDPRVHVPVRADAMLGEEATFAGIQQHEGWHTRCIKPDPNMQRLLREMPRTVYGDADAVMIANHLPSLLARYVESLDPRRTGVKRAGWEADNAEILDMERRAGIGSFGIEHAADVIRRLHGILDRARVDGHGPSAASFAALSAYLGDRLLPRLASAPATLPEGDAESLAAFAP